MSIINSCLCLLFILCITLSGCSNKSIRHQEGFGNYDISKDGKSIIFSWVVNKKSAIYRCGIDGKNVERIFSANEASFLNPRYSNSQKLIVFLSNEANSLNSAICIGDLKSKKIEFITDTNGIKTEAVFSAHDEKVFFCSANEYGANSLIASKSARGFDVYSVKIDSREIVKTTDLYAYALNNLTVKSDSAIAFRIFAGDDGGIFEYNLLTKKVSDKAHFASDGLDLPGSYSNPVYLTNNKFIFVVYNRFLLFDPSSKVVRVIFSSNFNISNVRYCAALHRIFFVEENSDGMIYSLNESGGDLQEIKLELYINDGKIN